MTSTTVCLVKRWCINRAGAATISCTDKQTDHSRQLESFTGATYSRSCTFNTKMSNSSAMYCIIQMKHHFDFGITVCAMQIYSKVSPGVRFVADNRGSHLNLLI